jgi:acetoacetyl-CoA synthetase
MEPLWKPSPERAASTELARFMKLAGKSSFEELHRWSIEDSAAFWNLVWDFGGVQGQRSGPTLVDGERMPGAKWFPGATLNYAENLLRERDDTPAIRFWGENRIKRQLSRRQLYDLVSRMSQALADAGVKKGDRVAGYLPNLPESTAAMLATTSLGAIWSSCSPDFGVQGVLDRFGQIEPKILFCADGYLYSGKEYDCQEKVAQVLEKLPTVEECVVIDYLGAPATVGTSLYDFLEPFDPAPIRFEQVEFNHPLYILYSSGTTGVPKCIVHGTGGSLLQHIKEHRLHSDVKPGDRLFYFTTLGWMMWNWLVSGLASGATLLLYDGSPFVERGRGAVRLRRRCRHDPLRHVGQVHRRHRQDRRRAQEDPQAGEAARGALDRISAAARRLRLRLCEGEKRRLPLLHFWRHRHRVLLRAGQSRGAGVARRDPGQRARSGGRGLR